MGNFHRAAVSELKIEGHDYYDRSQAMRQHWRIDLLNPNRHRDSYEK